MNIEKNNGMTIEQFEACAKELVPVLEKAQEIMGRHACGKYLRMTVSRDYMCAEGDALGGWTLTQCSDGGWCIRYEFSTVLTIAGEEVQGHA